MKKDYRRIERKEGIKYIRCQHLREGTQKAEMSAQWIGETTRLIVCPICESVRLGDPIKFLGFYDREPEKQTSFVPGFFERMRDKIEKTKRIMRILEE